MRYLKRSEVLELYRRIIERSGGSSGIRSMDALEAALAQPRMTFEGNDLYPTIVDKAASLAHSLIQNHPFLDGNKRTGHAAMETFLLLNHFEIEALPEEQEKIILQVASGRLGRAEFAAWLRTHIVERK